MSARPLVLTLGDPAGIGPEIALKAWKSLRGSIPVVLLADCAFLAPLARQLDVPIQRVSSVAGAVSEKALPVLHMALAEAPEPGLPSLENAASVVAMIERGVGLVLGGECSALVTNPVSKLVLRQGCGFAFPGHTEFLAHLTGGKTAPVMMLAAPELRVVPVTIHVALTDVPRLLTASLLEDTIRTTRAALTGQMGIANPRLAVAGLNPHAGEGGTMGREEIDIIIPVLNHLRAEGFDLTGPMSADTMFHTAARSRYDAAICMYHDQALIPLKTLNFSAGVNITLGLPLVRTSPDHGTAFDIAGKNTASPESLIAALATAWDMARQ